MCHAAPHQSGGTALSGSVPVCPTGASHEGERVAAAGRALPFRFELCLKRRDALEFRVLRSKMGAVSLDHSSHQESCYCQNPAYEHAKCHVSNAMLRSVLLLQSGITDLNEPALLRYQSCSVCLQSLQCFYQSSPP